MPNEDLPRQVCRGRRLRGAWSHGLRVVLGYFAGGVGDSRAPSYGIEQVGTIFIDGPSKSHIRDELKMIGMAEYQYYPEFTTFATAFQRQLNTKGKQHG